VLVLVVLGVLVCLCLPRVLASRNTARRRRADGKGGWIGLTQLGGGHQVAED
jgi:type II secretory pathway pseudopilin PulG